MLQVEAIENMNEWITVDIKQSESIAGKVNINIRTSWSGR
jgi:hypothetical protein